MKGNPGKSILAYGAFLILAGVAGFLSNPEKAKTALMSGGLFGALSLLWGWLAVQGRRWAVWAALVTAGLLTLTFAWRATVGWRQVAAGNEDKLFAAVLISTMLAASLALLPRLVTGLRRGAAA
ncbi:MAG: TMEM14 family protein [Limisphaerales bacterium]